MIDGIESFLAAAVGYAWGLPLVCLLVGGGLFLTLRSGLLPLFHGRHAVDILRGRYDRPDDPGQISHFRALSTALASTIGVGNIGGVAIAITQGGAGAVFWMWMAALVGMTTKYFTCTLAVLYRGRDSAGVLQGGPMYYIEEGLGPRFRPLAIFFATFGMVGCLPMFQTNQMAEILHGAYEVPPLVTATGATLLVAMVAFGGVERISGVAARLVPSMCVLYLGLAVTVLILHAELVPGLLARIVREAFTGSAMFGGAAGVAVKEVILIGVKRAAYSNEAGIGTAPLAHGAARTAEPVREGLVAMLGPFIDTIVICTLTALVILSYLASGERTIDGVEGVSLTREAIADTLGAPGEAALVVVVVLFALSTMMGFSYYGRKCFSYLFGAERAGAYTGIYLVGLFLGGIWTADAVINLVDTAFAMMALPNMIATLLLSPYVLRATRSYLKARRS